MSSMEHPCEYCGLNTKNRKYCSVSCGNKGRLRTDEYKANVSNSLKRYAATHYPCKHEDRVCECGNIFTAVRRSKKRYCSRNCINKYADNSNRGGFRLKSGTGKSGYYKGIYCNSTYELCWVIYNIDHNIHFNRFGTYITDGTIKYYPDFILPNGELVEIKGYYTDIVDKKCELAKSKGYNITVLYKNDLKHMFAYVKDNYGTDKFETLYEDFKCELNAVCDYCQTKFHKNKLKNKKMFCSRSCSGKYRAKINHG